MSSPNWKTGRDEEEGKTQRRDDATERQWIFRIRRAEGLNPLPSPNRSTGNSLVASLRRRVLPIGKPGVRKGGENTTTRRRDGKTVDFVGSEGRKARTHSYPPTGSIGNSLVASLRPRVLPKDRRPDPIPIQAEGLDGNEIGPFSCSTRGQGYTHSAPVALVCPPEPAQ